MWLEIIALLDKVFGILGQLVGSWIKKSDESKKIEREQQMIMDEAAKNGDFDIWKAARHRRNNA